jgi:hypothetical protein
MKATMKLMAVATAFALSGNVALAQDGGEGGDLAGGAPQQDPPRRPGQLPGMPPPPGVALDVTITLVPEGTELPDVVTADIMLPTDDEGLPIAAEAGVENSAAGLEIANSARADGRAFGESMAEAAQANREELGRGSRPALEDLVPTDLPVDLSGLPENPPEPSGRPDLPDLPEVPAPNSQ